MACGIAALDTAALHRPARTHVFLRRLGRGIGPNLLCRLVFLDQRLLAVAQMLTRRRNHHSVLTNPPDWLRLLIIDNLPALR